MAGESSYLHELAETIGPRPAATDAEARAADFIENVFHSRGLDVDRQEFDTPRTYSWAYILYHLLTVLAAVAAIRSPIPALAVAVVSAVLMWSDLDTRWGLSALMPKGPSQNIIAKHVPRTFRGERPRKVVIVAHYDTAKASLAFSPGLVRNFSFTFGLMKWCTWLVPVLIAAHILLARFDLSPWTWYATLVPAAYLLVPLLINLDRELFRRATAGANDNASGVAAMLGVMERILPEPEGGFETISMPAVTVERHDEEDAWDAGVVPEDALLTYTPASVEPRLGDFGEDVDWEEEPRPTRGQESLDFSRPEVPRSEEPSADAQPAHDERKRGVKDWLGIGGDFDVRREGRKIGSWEHFVDEDEDDDLGWKGGSAGEPFDDPDFASSEASRIRRMVTAGVDRELSEKEIWFVATGAEEVGTRGMLAFLSEYGDELRDAFIINIDNVGAGNLAWVTSEGMARRYHCDRRLQSVAKRVVREDDLPYRGRDYRGLSTDATAALARRFRAMSVMAFDINGRLPNWHWHTDTVENMQVETVEKAAEFVTRIIRGL